MTAVARSDRGHTSQTTRPRAFLAAVATAAAAAVAPPPQVLADAATGNKAGAAACRGASLSVPPATYRRLVLSLAGAAKPEDSRGPAQSIPLHLHCRGDRVTGGFTQVPLSSRDRQDAPVCVPYYLNTTYLKCNGQSIRGPLVGFTHSAHPGRTSRFDWQADLQLHGRRVTGTYVCELGGRKVSGTVSGTVMEEVDLRTPHNAFAPGRDFPCHRGRLGGGTTADCGRELVADLAEARLQWVSELKTAGAYDQGMHGSHSTPIFADGCAYMYYWEGCGSALRTEAQLGNKKKNQTRSMTPEELKILYAVECADVIACIDGVTGQTRWVARFPGNLDNGGAEGGHHTPVYADGKVYAQGANGKVYCLDARTGKLLWRKVDFPGTVVAYWDLVRKVRAFNEEPVGGIDPQMPPRPEGRTPAIAFLNTCPQYADGVLAVTDGGRNLVGLDGETGKELWNTREASRSPRAISGNETPIVWRHEGKACFLSARWCIEPRSGKVLWRVAGSVDGGNSIAANEQYMVCWRRHPAATDARFGKPVSTLSCYRITREKAELHWQLDGDYATHTGCPTYTSPAIAGGRVYAQTGSVGVCVDLETGKVLAKLGERRVMELSLVYSDGKCFSGSHDGWFSIVEAGPKACKFLSRSFPHNPTWVSHALADGRLFVRLNRGLACWDLRHPSYVSGQVCAYALDSGRSELLQGHETELRWRTINAESVRIEPDVGAVAASGAVRVRPAKTTRYRLIAEGKGGPQERSVEVTVYEALPAVKADNLKPGLAAAYYDYQGDGKLPSFDKQQTPYRKGIVKALEFEPPPDGPPTEAPEPGAGAAAAVPLEELPDAKQQFAGSERSANVAAVFEGFLKAPEDGLYEFMLESSDGSALLIGGRKAVDNDGRHDSRNRGKSGKLGLTAGYHPIRVLYCLGKGRYDFKVCWRRVGGARFEPVPGSALSHGP